MKIKHLVVPLLAILLALTVFRTLSAGSPPVTQTELETSTSQGSTLALRAASGAEITFKTQNGMTVDGVAAENRSIPHLVLWRNGTLTDPLERTVIVEIAGLQVPPTGVTITLQLETQHGDPDLGGHPDDRITVWQETRRIEIQDAAASFRHVFGAETMGGGLAVTTPTDYYRVELWVSDGLHTDQPAQRFAREHAFLLESQWVVPLPQVTEETEGAAPDELVLYICDMFPFRKRIADPTTWLARDKVPQVLQSELLPAMVEAFHIQTDVWGFPWHTAGTSYRPGPDAERLSVALSDGENWFHGRAPDKGHAGISITSNDNAHYDSLTDALMSNFHHELFHNLQRNLNLSAGGDGQVDGAEQAWRFFSEGTAVLASSVGMPEVEFARTQVPRSYQSYAKLFPLNESYEEMNPYRAALYWRFLYEGCGGMEDGIENPATGMQIIRNALTVLYAGEVVDIRSSTNLVEGLPAIMDRALTSTPACPFGSYAESLTEFARAIYQLQLEGGRCGQPRAAAGCGLYDPNGIYRDPPVSQITYDGEAITYGLVDEGLAGGIPNSFGIDLINVQLQAAADGQPLTVQIQGAPGAEARFSLQVWEHTDRGDLQELATLVGRPGSDGRLSYTLPALDTQVCSRLGLIITRLDKREGLDQAGEYTLILGS